MGNSQPVANVLSTCSRGGIIGSAVSTLSFLTPASIWWGLFGVASSTKLLYVYYICMTWWISFAINIILQEIIHQPSPYPSCYSSSSSYDKNANPSWELQQIYQYIIMINMHRFYYDGKFSLSSLIYAIALSIGLGAILWWSGNYSIEQIFSGAVVGIIVGAFFSLLLYLFFNDRLFPLARHSLVGNLCGLRCFDSMLDKLFFDWHDDLYPRDLVVNGKIKPSVWDRTHFTTKTSPLDYTKEDRRAVYL